MVTWERHTPTSDGNLIAWKVETGEAVARLHQKTFVKEYWPTLQWTADEELCAFAVTNEVQLFDGKSVNVHVVKYRIKCDGCSAVFTAGHASSSYRFAVFKPEKKVIRSYCIVVKYHVIGFLLLPVSVCVCMPVIHLGCYI